MIINAKFIYPTMTFFFIGEEEEVNLLKQYMDILSQNKTIPLKTIMSRIEIYKSIKGYIYYSKHFGLEQIIVGKKWNYWLKKKKRLISNNKWLAVGMICDREAYLELGLSEEQINIFIEKFS